MGTSADRDSSSEYRLLYTTLRKVKPSHCVCVTADGDETIVPIAGNRDRYQKCARACIAMNPQQVRLVDGEGRVADVVVLEELESAEPGEAGSSTATGVKRRQDEVAAYLKLQFDAADRAVERALSAQSKHMDGLVKVVETAMSLLQAAEKRIAQLEETHRKQHARAQKELSETAAALKEFAAEAGSSGGDDDDEDHSKATAIVETIIGIAMDQKAKKAAAAAAANGGGKS